MRAKNTSRQRQHLLECPNYLNAMKEHNPQNPLLELAANGTPTPAMKTPKKRDLDTMVNGFQGDASGSRSFPIPKPSLERDFQMCVQLNPKISVGPGIWGQRNWIAFVSGHWNGRWGKGTVIVRTFDRWAVDVLIPSAWWTRQATRCARSFYACRNQLSPSNARPSASIHRRPYRGLACWAKRSIGEAR